MRISLLVLQVALAHAQLGGTFAHGDPSAKIIYANIPNTYPANKYGDSCLDSLDPACRWPLHLEDFSEHLSWELPDGANAVYNYDFVLKELKKVQKTRNKKEKKQGKQGVSAGEFEEINNKFKDLSCNLETLVLIAYKQPRPTEGILRRYCAAKAAGAAAAQEKTEAKDAEPVPATPAEEAAQDAEDDETIHKGAHKAEDGEPVPARPAHAAEDGETAPAEADPSEADQPGKKFEVSQCEKAVFKFINGGHVNGALELDEWFHAFQRMDDEIEGSERDHIVSEDEFKRHMKCHNEEDKQIFNQMAGEDGQLSMEEWAKVFESLDGEKDYAIILEEFGALDGK